MFLEKRLSLWCLTELTYSVRGDRGRSLRMRIIQANANLDKVDKRVVVKGTALSVIIKSFQRLIWPASIIPRDGNPFFHCHGTAVKH